MNETVKRDIRKIEKESKKRIEDFSLYDWEYFCLIVDLSEDFLKHYKEKINWKSVSSNQNLSEEFIDQYSNRVYWNSIVVTQELSELMILKYKEILDWKRVSCFQKLSEGFIIEFEEILYWDELSKKQDFTYSFLMDNIHKVNINNFCIFNEMINLSEEEKEKVHNINRFQKIYGKI